LLGIGGIADIFNGVEHGIDTFDCVHPTRLARHGGALVRPVHNDRPKEHINLRNERFKNDFTPIEPDCPCHTCSNHSKAYIHHLLRAGELLAYSLISIHNVNFMNRLLTAIRKSINLGNLIEEKKKWVNFSK
jgi:queuine tRNA-ribosyltransferase